MADRVLSSVITRSGKNVPEAEINGSVSCESSEDGGAKNIDISESAMRYLDQLMKKQTDELTNRFLNSEKVLLAKISSLEQNLEGKDAFIDGLRNTISRVEN